ncbi:MAG: SDR family NAD(P)-dependent oxidoreductase [Phycisphaerales bacterium]|nr:SDR family NAD(P)-dependent oxidoreductase [Phycisphaerales bacterium]
MARKGYGTILIARREERLDALAQELRRWAPSHALPTDLHDRAEVDQLAAALGHHRPAVRILVNGAGCARYLSTLDQSEIFEHLMWVNALAAHRLTCAVLPGMIEARAGHIVNICSMSAHMGPWGHSGYAASKAALRALTESLAAETYDAGVRVTGVYPGIVATEWFEQPTMPRLWERVARRAVPPERVARAVAGAIDRPRLAVYVPWFYRLLPFIAGASPQAAMRLVRAGSLPLQGSGGTIESRPSRGNAQAIPRGLTR